MPVFASEVEPYAIAVTTSRFPQMQHLGNVMEIHGDLIPPVDVLTFGSPCQDVSIAGKQRIPQVGRCNRTKCGEARKHDVGNPQHTIVGSQL